mmetsp:Transcript_123237/g.343709  ORF Transcript_123237/g.343709 Transcript_123237/m.343709 type:complete len:337 (-) Transcript_123237:33-1043(-)
MSAADKYAVADGAEFDDDVKGGPRDAETGEVKAVVERDSKEVAGGAAAAGRRASASRQEQAAGDNADGARAAEGTAKGKAPEPKGRAGGAGKGATQRGKRGSAGDGSETDSVADRQIAAWDTDGDGKLSKAEARAAARQHKKKAEEATNLKKMVCAMILVCVFMLVSLLGLAYLASEWTKDSRTGAGGVLTDTDGNIVQTALAIGEVDLVDFPGKPLEVLRAVLDVLIPNGDEVLWFKVASWHLESSTKMQLYSPLGDLIEVDGQQVTVIEIDGTVSVLDGRTVAAGARRAAEAGDGDGAGAGDAGDGDAEAGARPRRLNAAGAPRVYFAKSKENQ